MTFISQEKCHFCHLSVYACKCKKDNLYDVLINNVDTSRTDIVINPTDMNREIKYRAFVRGFMVNVVSIDFVNRYMTWDDNQYDRCVPPNKCYEIESFDEIVLMQFTGLHDKNGKEIYEGDCDNAGNVVEYLEGCFTLNGDRPLSVMLKVFEVQGNIYENQTTTP